MIRVPALTRVATREVAPSPKRPGLKLSSLLTKKDDSPVLWSWITTELVVSIIQYKHNGKYHGCVYWKSPGSTQWKFHFRQKSLDFWEVLEYLEEYMTRTMPDVFPPFPPSAFERL